MLQLAYDAKLADGRNAFIWMHGGADRGDKSKHWKGGDRTNRMNEHYDNGLARRNVDTRQYTLAKGVTPAELGVSQDLVDALAAYRIIPKYDVNASTHVPPVV